MADAKWYVVHTYSGYENKVKANIEKTIENRGLQDQIVEVSIPMEQVMETKANGKRELVSKKLFPGYVLIHMVMNDDTWYVVRNTRGVTGFVGPGSKPVPLTEAEMMKYKGAESSADTEVVSYDFEIGDKIEVISGAWAETEGIIRSINQQKQTVKIIVDMFGRETPVELGFNEIRVER